MDDEVHTPIQVAMHDIYESGALVTCTEVELSSLLRAVGRQLNWVNLKEGVAQSSQQQQQ